MALAGVGLLLRARRKTSRIYVDRSTAQIRIGRRSRSLGPVAAFELAGMGEPFDDTADEAYRVHLVFGDGRRQLLLDGDDPAHVLMDLRRILAVWPLPVRSGWGLPKHAAPWSIEASTNRLGRGSPGFSVIGAPMASTGSALATGIGGALIAAIIALVLESRLSHGAEISRLSLVLPILGLTFLFLFAASLASARVRITKNHVLVIEQRTLSLTWRTTRIEASDVVAAYAVQPNSGHPAHLLLQTGTRLVAVRCSGDAARAVAARLLPEPKFNG